MQRFHANNGLFSMTTFYGRKNTSLVVEKNTATNFIDDCCNYCPKLGDEGCTANTGQICNRGEIIDFIDVHPDFQAIFKKSIYFEELPS